MPTTLAFLILPQTHLMDLAGPDQVFLEAIEYGADLDIAYCGLESGVTSSAGLPLGKLPHFSEIELKKDDFLLIPGSNISYFYSQEFRAQTTLLDWIRKLHEQKVRICSICSGAFVLALSGILDGKICTTHWKRTGELQAKFPKLRVAENVLFTEQDGIYTSAGIAAGIDLALHIVAQLQGEMMAHKVAREMVVYSRRSGSQPQKSAMLDYRNHIHAGIHRVQDWLQEHLHQKSSLTQLADIACMSDRNFTRTFKKETGLTVMEYITLLRQERIGKMMLQPDHSRTQIARLCGLRSERQLNRIMQKSARHHN